MKTIVFLLLFHLALLGGSVAAYHSVIKRYSPDSQILIETALLGLVGGCTYCIRALYIQFCVKKEWDNRWIVWHLSRPAVSTICGIVSLLFIKAGLLIFEASPIDTANQYGIYALAFIAGFNVDNFLKKIESIFKEIVGIRLSNSSKNGE